MSTKYKIQDEEQLYFVTFTVINWIDAFIREDYNNMFLANVRHCQEHKGLDVYAWCIMPSHVHMILASDGNKKLDGTIRDLKSFTSRKIRLMLEDPDNEVQESRKDWMLWIMKREGMRNGRNNDFQFWQQDYHPIELNSNYLKNQRLNYTHINPVVAGFVDRPEDWRYSSARDYAGEKGLLDIKFIG